MNVDGRAVEEELQRQLTTAAGGRIDIRKLWRAAGSPTGKSPVRWEALVKPEPGVTRDGGRPDDPVWADEATARDYVHYFDPRFGPGRIGRPDLDERGWSDALIRKLLPRCDATRKNPVRAKSPRCRLYLLSRVEEVEASGKFREAVEQSRHRREASLKGVATKSEKMRQWQDGLDFPVPDMEWDTLVQVSCAHYNAHNRESDSRATPDSTPDFLERIAVNYLRHVTTTYDKNLDEAKGKTGARTAYEGINEKVYDAISEVYPELSAACDRQLIRKDQIAGYDPLRRR